MKDWTIIVYLAGDNNLSDDMSFSLADIQDFTRKLTKEESENINLLAFFDSNSLTAPTQYFDFSDPQNPIKESVGREHLYHPYKSKHLLENMNYESDSASAYSIMNFFHWCIKTRKRTAKNYVVIFSGHSFGFHGSSFLRDESSGKFMTIFKFRRTLEEITKLYLKKKIGILGFDSCVMSMLEVGYELKDTAQTIVASEGSIPNSGWAYGSMFRELISTFAKTEKTPLNVKDSACSFVKGFIEKQKEYAVGGRSVDIAAWDLDLIEPVAEAVSKLAVELHDRLNLPRLMRKNGAITKKDVFIFEQLKNAILQSHIYCQTYMAEQSLDLKDFCHRLAVECRSLEEQMKLVGYESSAFSSIKVLCGNVIRAVGKCVLKSGYCGDTFQFSNGMSLYFPWTALAYSETYLRYQYLRINRGSKTGQSGIGSSWNNFLFYYLFVATLRKKRGIANIDFTKQFNELAESGLAEEHWTPATIDNWILSTRESWRLGTKDSWLNGTRDSWLNGTRGQMSAYSDFFGQFKNYQLDWELSGFSDAEEFDENTLTCGYFDIAK